MLEKRQQFTFVWGFTGGDTTNLVSCQPTSIFVDRDEENGSTTQSVPPYTLIAYPEEGTPTVDLLGAGPTNIPWTPRFQPGTKVLLNVVDSLGNSGGVAQVLYTVGAGTSTSCVPASSNSDMSINVQSSGTLNTCDTVPIQISGGSAPYKVTIAVTNASSAVNTTLTGQNNLYQWVERADPGQSLIIAVSDSNGEYAPTSSFFTTGGSTDKTCSGKQDSQSVAGATNSASYPPSQTSGQTTASASSATQSTAPSKDGKSLTGPIVGTIVALLVVFGLVAFWFFRRRQRGRSYDGSSILGGGGGGGGFGMKDYKRGGNMHGNDSFVPLHDNASPSAPRTPLYQDAHSSEHTASNSLSGLGSSGAGSNRPVSGFEYYSAPPSNYSGTVETSGPSRMNTLSGPGTGLGVAAAGVAASGASSGAMSKRQMALEERQRNQRWGGGSSGNYPPAPESVYPPQSNYTANPFADPAQPYRPPPPPSAPPSAIGSERAPPSTFDPAAAYGYSAYGVTPATYQPSHAGSRPGGSQDTITTATPAARAKAAEAARERQQPPVPEDDDDEEPIPYMQRVRPVLGVTNPDRASTATSNSANDPYGGLDRSRPPTQVYQHEDAGVIELPPAYREFSNATPGPGQPRQ